MGLTRGNCDSSLPGAGQGVLGAGGNSLILKDGSCWLLGTFDSGLLGTFGSGLLEDIDCLGVDKSLRGGLLLIVSLFRSIGCLDDCDREGILPSGGRGVIGGKLNREESLEGSGGSEEDPKEEPVEGNEDNGGS